MVFNQLDFVLCVCAHSYHIFFIFKGSINGYQRLEQMGTELARHGFVGVHVQHRSSVSTAQHELDRPADVSFVIDQLSSAMEKKAALDRLNLVIDFDRIGHVGHSWGGLFLFLFCLPAPLDHNTLFDSCLFFLLIILKN